MFDIPVPDFSDSECGEPECEESCAISKYEKTFNVLYGFTLEKWLNDQNNEIPVTIFDCRFDYEYEAGHIKGAITINNPENIECLFKDAAKNGDQACLWHNLVFYCEYSQNRGPEMASVFRKIDRILNLYRYPHLYYNHIYILAGGFRQFYQLHPDLCDGYHLPMDARSDLVHHCFYTRRCLIKSLLEIYEKN